MERSHEKIVTILKEKDKYEKMKDNLRSNEKYEIMRLRYEIAYMWMIDITKETFEENDIEVKINGVAILWLNENHIEGQLSHRKFTSNHKQIWQNIQKTDMN